MIVITLDHVVLAALAWLLIGALLWMVAFDPIIRPEVRLRRMLAGRELTRGALVAASLRLILGWPAHARTLRAALSRS